MIRQGYFFFLLLVRAGSLLLGPVIQAAFPSVGQPGARLLASDDSSSSILSWLFRYLGGGMNSTSKFLWIVEAILLSPKSNPIRRLPTGWPGYPSGYHSLSSALGANCRGDIENTRRPFEKYHEKYHKTTCRMEATSFPRTTTRSNYSTHVPGAGLAIIIGELRLRGLQLLISRLVLYHLPPALHVAVVASSRCITCGFSYLGGTRCMQPL